MEHQTVTIERDAERAAPDPARELLVYMRLAEQEDQLRNTKPEKPAYTRPETPVDRAVAPTAPRSERARFNLD
jgi:hypothetical protein